MTKNDPTQNVGLFDLTKDPHEVNNLAESYPEKIVQMEKTISEIRKDISDKLQSRSENQNDLTKNVLSEEKLQKQVFELVISNRIKLGLWLRKHKTSLTIAQSHNKLLYTTTGSAHVLPDFLIIGAARSGTT